MCGIAGIVGAPSEARAARVDAMLDRMRHRGPDGRGAADGGLARLGCVRLAIRGGERARQPFRTRRGLLVFNGEIYNLPELVKDLRWHGIEIGGGSDTEAVGALLDVYGPEAVDRLDGMYAFAWDDGAAVWLARDPAGQKPLHYRAGADGAAFASEIAPLLDGRPAIHAPAMARWLAFHCAHGVETMFRGILRVPPGGIVALPEGRVVRERDAALEFASPNPGLTPERLSKVLARSVRDALPAEPFGVALSGGVDSSLVAGCAPGAFAAFHGRVAAEGFDESPHARAAAAGLGLRLVEVPVTAERCLDALPRVVRALEEPVAGPGALGQWLVCERAARDVRILLSGCGGDELFGGYARAAALRFDAPPPGLEAYAPLFLRARGLAPEERARRLLDRSSPDLFARDFLAAHPAPEEEFRAAFRRGGLDPESAAARLEIEWTLPALLQVEDRVSMAFSLESRAPLLDRRLLRAAARLAPEARVDGAGRLKALFRRAAAPFLPPSVRAREDKMGFPHPVGAWIAGPWRDFARGLLGDRRARERGVFDPAGIEAALAQPGRHDRPLYAALFLELWMRTFLDGNA